MNAVASYKSSRTLATDTRVNLLYGLNGTGKSTISDFLYEPTNPKFSHCSFESEGNERILVYNQSFIRDAFFESETLPGIFSLSPENKEAERNIAECQREIQHLQGLISANAESRQAAEAELSRKRKMAVDATWKIKADHSRGDGALDFCLEGLRGKKEQLFSFLLSVPKPITAPEKTTEQILKEAEALQDDSAGKLPLLSPLKWPKHDVEDNDLLGRSIVGNVSSPVAELISNLENSDWVRAGLAYIPQNVSNKATVACPFCQEATITARFISNITDYFDEQYRSSVSELERLGSEYREAFQDLTALETYTLHPQAEEFEKELEDLYHTCREQVEANLRTLKEKLDTPDVIKKLTNTKPAFSAFNSLVRQINDVVKAQNERLANKQAALANLKREFWSVMRWHYDQTISRYQLDDSEANTRIGGLASNTTELVAQLRKKEQELAEAQKKTVNIDQAVSNINGGLLDLGMGDFKIIKYSETLYKIVRTGQPEEAFHSLSEGEKMIISFLYFCELCRGKPSAAETRSKCIAVIDDPISSLSHIYVFNVGQLIKSLFFGQSNVEQVFVLTHSLYFFYELTEPRHEKRKETQKLFRLTKNTEGSELREMRYEEIQNDYQSYWAIVRDSHQHPALVANCMRNIVEYFFSFVLKRDLNNVFQMPKLKQPKFQAFLRYINRESHSLGQNIFDIKEFDYGAFREGFHSIFKETGFGEHYRQMMGE